MKCIIYAGTELVTGDEIAIGVLRYCEALAGSIVAEIIEIPVREPDGSLSTATLLVGPASEMVLKNVASEWEEIVDPAVMHRLTERTRAQQLVADTTAQSAASDRDEADDPSDDWRSDY